MALLAAILQYRQDVAIEGDLLRDHWSNKENGSNQKRDHYLNYIRAALLTLQDI